MHVAASTNNFHGSSSVQKQSLCDEHLAELPQPKGLLAASQLLMCPPLASPSRVADQTRQPAYQTSAEGSVTSNSPPTTPTLPPCQSTVRTSIAHAY